MFFIEGLELPSGSSSLFTNFLVSFLEKIKSLRLKEKLEAKDGRVVY
jgi:hypothetical protein